MTARSIARRGWPFAAAAVGGFGLAWVVIAVFVFPPGAPPSDGTIPNVIGLSLDGATSRLQRAGFKAQRGELRFEDAVPRMSVIGMTPKQGTRAPLGTPVVLDLSAGPKMGVVPNVVGMLRQQAESTLGVAGFRANADTIIQASDQPVGTVVSTRPSGGASAAVPSVVQLVFSGGPATIPVPDLTGRTIVEARVLLEQLGLELGDVTILTSGGTSDQAAVVQQKPPAGTVVPPGTRVAVSVSGDSTS